MDISLNWLNRYLEPGGMTADEAEHTLTEAGFPFEGRTALENGDTLLDVEVTSNRGDCLSHVGCAREIAGAGIADPKRLLKMPEIVDPPTGAPASDSLTLENRVPEGCPHFSARVIRGVKVGPSPAWLVEALESVGSRSINNVVDVTNFITLELGNPCHVFDLGKLSGNTLIVRHAEPGEKIKTLYEGEHKLKPADLVVADAERPQSLAGIIGGFDSQVDEGTTDVVFEMATWDPVTIRTTGRRMNIRTDAAFRFERGIDPRSINDAARRAVQLLCELSGGELGEGVLEAGAPMPEDVSIVLRPSRCAQVLGIQTPAEQIAQLLTPLQIKCEIESDSQGADVVRCTIPPHRSHDLTREIDLVEEVARTRTLAVVPLIEKIPVAAPHPSNTERAVSQIASVLTGQGFYETVTFSFTSPENAALFCPPGVETVAVDDDRRKAEPTLRPSVLPSLLQCRKANQDGRVHVPGGVRLFELAAVFGQVEGADRESTEHRVLSMLMDVPGEGPKRKPEQVQHGVRILRGAIDRVVQACFGAAARTRIETGTPASPGWDDVFGRVIVEHDEGKVELGVMGLVSSKALQGFGLDLPMVACEVDLSTLTGAYPPKASAHALPRFPGVDRDVSLIVDESTEWSGVEALVREARLDKSVGHALVGVFRGKQVGPGKKSVTVRVSFRDPDRTLRHEEVDPQMERFTAMARESLGAQIRG